MDHADQTEAQGERREETAVRVIGQEPFQVAHRVSLWTAGR